MGCAADLPRRARGAHRRGDELVGLAYDGPYDHLPAVEGVDHRVVPWDDVTLDEGTGVVHIAPGCGAEDFELSRVHDLAVLAPVDEAGHFYDDYGWLHGLSTVESADQIVQDIADRGRLYRASEIVHRYPHCWRCHTPLIFRLTDDWFLAADPLRQRLVDANAEVDWTPDYFGKRMDDWLRNMGDWNISSRRYYGLPLPFYECACGHLTVVGSRRELEERALRGLDQLQELRRPWIDEVPIRCEACNKEVRRIPEVGDVWLDAGIVPFSTLGWQNPEWVEGGFGTGAARGLTNADLPDHPYWEQWFPADWVSEMREQIRLWFYSQLFMSVALVGRAPFRAVLGYEKMFDEHGREMHGSWGNMIEAEDAFARMGADVMRWQFCGAAAQPEPALRLRPSARDQAQAAHALELGARARDVRQHRRVPPLLRGPRRRRRPGGAAAARPLARGAHGAAHGGRHLRVRGVPHGRRAAGVRSVRRRPVELVHPPLTAALLGRRRGGAAHALGRARPVTAHGRADRAVPHRAPVAEPCARCRGRRARLHLPGRLAGARRAGRAPLEEMGEVRRVVELARQARSSSGLKLRQPLRRLVVQGASAAEAHRDEIADELRVKEVEFGPVEADELRVKPNLPVLGPKLGRELGAVRSALEAGEFEQVDGGRFRVAGHDLAPDEVLVERRPRPGWAVAEDDGYAVALATDIDEELRLEGRAYDLIHMLNAMRRQAGFELTDRIAVTLPRGQEELLRHADWIKREVLATRLDIGDVDEPEIAKA